MKISLFHLLSGRKKNLSLKEILAKTHITSNEHDIVTLGTPFVTANKNIQFKYVANDTVTKRLGLTHDPKVKTTYPENHEKLTFNQRTSHLHTQLKKGLKKLN